MLPFNKFPQQSSQEAAQDSKQLISVLFVSKLGMEHRAWTILELKSSPFLRTWKNNKNKNYIPYLYLNFVQSS